MGWVYNFRKKYKMTTKKHSRQKGIYKVTAIGSIVNFILLVFKFIAGIIGNSAAMIADAVHSLSDFITDIIVVIFVKISSKPADESHHYGHGKYETLATAIIGIILLGVGIGIFYDGGVKITKFIIGDRLPQPRILALIAAIVSILLKEILYHYTIIKGRKLNSQAVIANAWHHRSDALSSIGTAVGIGGAILLGDKWCVLDPIAAVIVSLFIIKVACKLIKPCVEELLERSLPNEVEENIKNIILSFPQVTEPHHLRTRRIGNNVAIEVHIRLNGNISLREAHNVTNEIELRLKKEYGMGTHVGIHMEPIR